MSGAQAELERLGVKKDNIVVEDVSGSFELPLAASRFVLDAKVYVKDEKREEEHSIPQY